MSQISTSTIRHGSLSAYLVQPKAPSDGALLLLPMITGIGARVREFAADFARSGLTTLCWDPFHGASSDTHTLEQLAELRNRLDDRAALNEQRELLDYLQQDLGIQRTGVIGYCLGGRFALLLAADDPRVASVVAYHPTVTPVPAPNHSVDPFAVAARITAPVMIHYPGQDHLVPRECLTRLQTELQSRDDAVTAVHCYPKAEHGFSDDARHGNANNVAAYHLAQAQTIAFVRSTTSDADLAEPA